MAITAAKKARIKGKEVLAARQAFVLKNSSFKSLYSPFCEANWDQRVRAYLETGDRENLRDTPLNRHEAP